MSKRRCIWTLCLMSCILQVPWAQDSSAQSGQPAPAPAYGAENPPATVGENPPLSGLDLPSLEPHVAPISYLQPGATFSESVSTNINNDVGASKVGSITRGLGTLTLKRLWSHYDLALDYVGGVGYYTRQSNGGKLLQDFGLQQKVTWKRGEFSVRDSFSYLPEGNFGAAYGSLGSSGIVTVGNTAFGSFFG